jgi:hypothetical protein
VGWALPYTRHSWEDTLDLDGPGRINSEILELLPVAHTCQAWRAAVQPQWVDFKAQPKPTSRENPYSRLCLLRSIWKHVRVATVHGTRRLDLLTRLSWLTHLINNVAIELHWDAAFDDSGSAGNWHSEIRGEQAEYFCCDRQAVLNRLVGSRARDNRYT